MEFSQTELEEEVDALFEIYDQKFFQFLQGILDKTIELSSMDSSEI